MIIPSQLKTEDSHLAHVTSYNVYSVYSLKEKAKYGN